MKAKIEIFHHGDCLFSEVVSTQEELDALLAQGKEWLMDYSPTIIQNCILTIINQDLNLVVGMIVDDADGCSIKMIRPVTGIMKLPEKTPA